MAEKTNEQVIADASLEQRRKALDALPALLVSLLGSQVISATYGYGSYLHPDLCYIPMKVGTSWLERFIRESLEQRIVVLGESDFTFFVQDGRLEIEFCHEGHIHVSGTDRQLIAEVLRHPAFASGQSSVAHGPEV